MMDVKLEREETHDAPAISTAPSPHIPVHLHRLPWPEHTRQDTPSWWKVWHTYSFNIHYKWRRSSEVLLLNYIRALCTFNSQNSQKATFSYQKKKKERKVKKKECLPVWAYIGFFSRQSRSLHAFSHLCPCSGSLETLLHGGSLRLVRLCCSGLCFGATLVSTPEDLPHQTVWQTSPPSPHCSSLLLVSLPRVIPFTAFIVVKHTYVRLPV